MVFAIGLVSILLLHIYQRGKWVFLSFATSGSAILALLAAFGSLDKGPLAKILHQNSVIYRGDYWHAGWKMSIEHPWFGVGLDSYGDWYRRSRTLAATLRRGPNITSDTAHNALLDFSANGGFPLLLAYLFFISLTVLSVVKIFKDRKLVDPVFIALVGGWIAFQSQSIISINQIGLAIWGWLFAGAIMGYSKLSPDQDKSSRTNAKSKQQSSQESLAPAGAALSAFIGLVVGLLIALPPMVRDTQFRNIQTKSGDSQKIIELVNSWPLDSIRMNRGSVLLANSGLNVLSAQVALNGTKSFPNDYASWYTLYELSGDGSTERETYRAILNRIDPFNPKYFDK
jgi:hypothetical protein